MYRPRPGPVAAPKDETTESVWEALLVRRGEQATRNPVRDTVFREKNKVRQSHTIS